MNNEQLNETMKKLIGEVSLDSYQEFFDYGEEFSNYLASDNVPEFKIMNGTYMVPDAHVYYGIIKKYNPKTIIEIGCGNSTKIANFACQRDAKIITIDSNEQLVETMLLLEKVTFFPSKLEDVDLAMFEALNENDILFIDSSHILKECNDVCVELIKILPSLKKGVVIHFHDIYMPYRYDTFYSVGDAINWNEQYALMSILLNSDNFKVIWPGVFLEYNFNVSSMFNENDQMKAAYPLAVPSSFWISKTK